MNNYELIILTGSKGVGKHTFLDNLVGKEERRRLISNYDGYNFVNFHVIKTKIDDQDTSINFHIIPIDFQEKILNRNRYKRLFMNKKVPLILLLMFDITKSTSLEDLLLLANIIKDSIASSAKSIFLLGNKADLIDKLFVNSEIISNAINYLKIKLDSDVTYFELNSLNKNEIKDFFTKKLMLFL